MIRKIEVDVGIITTEVRKYRSHIQEPRNAIIYNKYIFNEIGYKNKKKLLNTYQSQHSPLELGTVKPDNITTKIINKLQPMMLIILL